MNRKLFVLSSLFFISAGIFFPQSQNEASGESLFEDSQQEVSHAMQNEDAQDTRIGFSEVWGYVMNGVEKEFSPEMPITDVGYFIPAVTTFSEIPSVPPKSQHFSDFSGKVHVVTSCDSKSQTHLLLDPKLGLRKKIISQLVKACETYDGLQIDWELVPHDDWENYYTFLKTLKKKLRKDQILSVAISARVKTLEKDAYDYTRLSTVADKIIIMAYDQHWSTSAPGPIASPEWGKKIYDYAQTIIPEKKLIFGAPFYGRAWTNEDIGARAWKNRSMEKIFKENKITDNDVKTDSEGNKYLTLKKERTITVYFDDTESSTNRISFYKNLGINRIAFWRVGQETSDFWSNMKIEN